MKKHLQLLVLPQEKYRHVPISAHRSKNLEKNEKARACSKVYKGNKEENSAKKDRTPSLARCEEGMRLSPLMSWTKDLPRTFTGHPGLHFAQHLVGYEHAPVAVA